MQHSITPKFDSNASDSAPILADALPRSYEKVEFRAFVALGFSSLFGLLAKCPKPSQTPGALTHKNPTTTTKFTSLETLNAPTPGSPK